MLYWNIPTALKCCTLIFLLTEYFGLEYSLLTEYVVLEYSYWPNMVY